MAKSSELDAARKRAQHCRSCDLYKHATQTVFGEGRPGAEIMLVGEQPGDQEDLAGKPFVGPAGRMLDKALEEIGLDRRSVYVTNAVKHFKFMLRGKRRIHKKPLEREIAACLQWLEAEVHALHPKLVVALGATAARAVLGHPVTIETVRGAILKQQRVAATQAADVLVTVHPSYLLRVPPEDRDAAYARFVSDLKRARAYG